MKDIKIADGTGCKRFENIDTRSSIMCPYQERECRPDCAACAISSNKADCNRGNFVIGKIVST